MRLSFLAIYFLAAAAESWSFVCGNPAQPDLLSKGVVPFKNKVWSLRVAFLDDYVYSHHFNGEFEVGPVEEKPPVLSLASETAQITLNYARRLDLYGLVGSSKMQMDQEVFARRQFSWGLGAKAVVFELDCFRIGADLKYFQSNQKPLFLVSSGLALDIESDLMLFYREYQGSFGLSYQSGIFCPYINGTYINAKIEPNQYGFLVHVPGFEEPMDASIRSFSGSNAWGMAVGASLVMGEKGTLSVESRFFNQNGINASLEIKF
jgi:hypothetical protein